MKKLATVLSLLVLVASVQAAPALAPAGMMVDGDASMPANPVAVPPQVATTTWTDTSGRDHSLSTQRKPGESETHWANRHSNAVNAFIAVFPPA